MEVSRHYTVSVFLWEQWRHLLTSGLPLAVQEQIQQRPHSTWTQTQTRVQVPVCRAFCAKPPLISVQHLSPDPAILARPEGVPIHQWMGVLGLACHWVLQFALVAQSVRPGNLLGDRLSYRLHHLYPDPADPFHLEAIPADHPMVVLKLVPHSSLQLLLAMQPG